MARVEWTRVAPDDVEHLVAVLLCRENPAAKRIRPSRGDGGIDILAPSSDGSGVVVYQVKSFSSNLSASQKGQVERSFRRLLDFAKQRGLRIAEWYLTVPLDSTHENLDWFRTVTADCGFAADWRGLAFLDGLASKYPDVVDYYLHDGRARLKDAMLSLTIALGVLYPARTDWHTGEPRAQGTGLTPSATVDGLAGLHAALNEHDPHFRYDFSVDAIRPDLVDQPGLVAATQVGDDARCVTFKIFALCCESVVERPVPLNITISAQPETELAQDLKAFERYGIPFTAPPGTTAGTVDLPGGLGGVITGGTLSLEPATASAAAQYDLRLRLLDEADDLLAEALVHMQEPTTGLTGRGVRAYGTEQHEAFDFEILTDLDTGEGRISLRPRE